MLRHKSKKLETGLPISTFEQKNSKIKNDLLHYILKKNQGVAIIEIRNHLNLSFHKVNLLIKELIEEKVLVETGKSKARGRSASLYNISSQAGYFMGVEIKINKIYIGIINLKKEWVGKVQEIDFHLSNNAEALSSVIKEIEKNIKSSHIKKDLLLGLSIVMPGRMNTVTGENINYFNFLSTSLQQEIEANVHIPTLVDNDTRAIAWAEYLSGDGMRKEKNILFINLNHGLGLGIIIDKKLYYGKNGYSGELGHTPYFKNEIICHCGKKGCLETEVSGGALIRNIQSQLNKGTKSILSLDSKTPISLENIIEACLKGDPLAVDLVDKMGRRLGMALAGLMSIFNPEQIVIGGEMALTKDYLLLPIKNALNKYSLSLVNQETEIKIASGDQHLGVLGACLLAYEKFFFHYN